MQFGTKVNGRRQIIYASAAESVATKPGEVYELTIHTEDIPDENTAITQVLALEGQVADLKVLYVETHPDNTITLQFMDTGPGAIALGAVFGFLPGLLFVAGLIIVGILAYQIYFSASSWLLPALIVIGGGLALIYLTASASFFKSDSTSLRHESTAETEKRTEKQEKRKQEDAEKRLTQSKNSLARINSEFTSNLAETERKQNALEDCLGQQAATSKAVTVAQKNKDIARIKTLEQQLENKIIQCNKIEDELIPLSKKAQDLENEYNIEAQEFEIRSRNVDTRAAVDESMKAKKQEVALQDKLTAIEARKIRIEKAKKGDN